MRRLDQIENNCARTDGSFVQRYFQARVRRRLTAIRLILLLVVTTSGTAFVPPAFSEEDEVAGLTELLNQDPNNVDLLKQRAALLRLEQRHSESLGDLDRARLLEPNDRQIGLLRAQTLSALRRDQDAEVELEIFLRSETGRARVFALAERAEIGARAGRTGPAIADYNAAIAIEPALDLYLARGKLQEFSGQTGAAVAGYQNAISRLGPVPSLTNALIRLQIAQGQFQSALDVIEGELARTPNKTLWLVRRAEVLAAMGQPAQAKTDLGQALVEANRVLESKVTGLHLFSRAKVLIEMGLTQEAREDLEGCLALAPGFVDCRLLLRQL
jgi:tetratricopeptide (TPR) repeat protein